MFLAVLEGMIQRNIEEPIRDNVVIINISWCVEPLYVNSFAGGKFHGTLSRVSSNGEIHTGRKKNIYNTATEYICDISITH